ncbi:hypothetical protein PtA15_4A826 [Puccinia triticina]|uniref:Uncharacterized protein n=1 Tax=Puccinia triticina TaxID=208348 RepID=A0ABY7CJ33_9BASI|nr:uncharacterized protein PtA15_4A826 [Puccinia triticina]WAQ84373.1 hypothetical protein PtA15_4A826 [Puccinia triticina]
MPDKDAQDGAQLYNNTQDRAQFRKDGAEINKFDAAPSGTSGKDTPSHPIKLDPSVVPSIPNPKPTIKTLPKTTL